MRYTEIEEKIREGDLEKVKDIYLKENGFFCGESVTFLHFAALWDQPKIIEFFLGEGFDVNTEDKNGKTPLQYAVGHIAMEAMKYLLKKGADPRKKDKFGISPFSLAKRLKNHRTIDKKYKEAFNLLKNNRAC